MNMDSKKQRKPFAIEDFCFFVDRDQNKPEAKAAAAYMRLVKDGQLPPWAVFCFSDFKHAEADPRPASEVAIIHANFILLAPVEIDNGYQGLLLAEHCVSLAEVDVSFDSKDLRLKLPEIEGYVVAKAEQELDLLTRPV